ncbi:glycosyltransferase family 39 protein [Granulicella sp. L46]|uniref:glycosyltransferase family 39 protein n=1 Tax=Granulicella sp. L46 TaxID=1641865 RepID=UPI00131E96D6|nr:glycosyltransferase family 39 protein [Granulicella sp. L46]
MQLVRRFRIPALFCAVSVLVCELISHPFAEMGISDDGPYVSMVHTLATTGHILYTGWAAPMLVWQLIFAAAFVKLFGFSYSVVRMSTILNACVMAFVLQRILVRVGISERNATLGTLALVLSPLYLVLSATFLTDITGLFAIVICLYGCLRALQSATDRGAIAWLVFAVITNAIFGTSRQIAWLGILVMLPSTLWLLRSRRQVVIAGVAATLAGVLFIVVCLQWLKHQPYSIPEHLIPTVFPFANPIGEIAHTIGEFVHTFLDVPFLLLPLFALFLPQIRKSRSRVQIMIAAISLIYLLFAIHLKPSHPDFLLEPTAGARGGWVGIHSIHEGTDLLGEPPIFLPTVMQILITIISIGGLLGLLASFARSRASEISTPVSPYPRVSWKQLAILLAPYTTAYTLLLIPRATNLLFDRYMLAPLVILVLCLVRYYQDTISPRIPVAGVLLVAIMAGFGVVHTHNTFAFYRARVTLAAEVHSAGIPDTSVDNGWEHNFDVELQHSDHINFPTIVVPAHAYVLTPPPPPNTCKVFWYDYTPHIHALYGVSFDPNSCYGPASFAPAHYSRWLARTPGTLYVVRYTPLSNP